MESLTALVSLNLSRNPFRELPDLSGWAALQVLNLTDVGLSSPDRLPPLPPTLTTLILSHNPIQGLPEHMESLSGTLTVLTMENCSLSEVPPVLWRLTALSELVLDGNQIQALAEEGTSCLENLEVLSLKGNRIGRDGMPDTLFILPRLTRVNLHDNPLTVAEVRQVSGFEEYEERLRLLRDKQMRGGAMLDFSLCGLDEERK